MKRVIAIYLKPKQRVLVFKKLSFLLISMLLVFSGGIGTVYAQTATINANTIQQNIRGFGAANITGWRDDLTSADRTTAFSVNICKERQMLF